jgi:ethanolamine utilization protein EutQ (cupin superfamily)
LSPSIDAKEFSIRNVEFINQLETKFVDQARVHLGCGEITMKATPSQLVVVPEGSEMSFSVSSKEKSVATLVVCLASDFEGT